MTDMGPILAEIERLKADCAYWNNEHSKETVRADKYRLEAKNERELSESIVAEREQLYSQIESLKAITELAVNALKQNDEVLRELHSQIGQDSDINPSAKKVYLSKIQYIGETVGFHTLYEIERLQNEGS